MGLPAFTKPSKNDDQEERSNATGPPRDVPAVSLTVL
jgi:hypothetical protein